MPLNPAVRRYVYQLLERCDLLTDSGGYMGRDLNGLNDACERTLTEFSSSDCKLLHGIGATIFDHLGYKAPELLAVAPIPPDQQARMDQLTNPHHHTINAPDDPYYYYRKFTSVFPAPMQGAE